MARKKNMNPETYFKPFPINLRNLMEEFNENQGDLANAITKPDGTHLQRQTISLYANGDSIPDYEIVAQIAKHYGVTVDWLIGMPNATRSPETDLQGVCNYLNLSETVVQKIKSLTSKRYDPNAIYNKWTSYRSLFDYLFDNDGIDNFFNHLHEADTICATLFLDPGTHLIYPDLIDDKIVPFRITYETAIRFELREAFDFLLDSVYKVILNPPQRMTDDVLKKVDSKTIDSLIRAIKEASNKMKDLD